MTHSPKKMASEWIMQVVWTLLNNPATPIDIHEFLQSLKNVDFHEHFHYSFMKGVEVILIEGDKSLKEITNHPQRLPGPKRQW